MDSHEPGAWRVDVALIRKPRAQRENHRENRPRDSTGRQQAANACLSHQHRCGEQREHGTAVGEKREARQDADGGGMPIGGFASSRNMDEDCESGDHQRRGVQLGPRIHGVDQEEPGARHGCQDEPPFTVRQIQRCAQRQQGRQRRDLAEGGHSLVGRVERRG